MTSFVDVMYQWHRMCDTFFQGSEWDCNKNCPMYKYKICSAPKDTYPQPLEFEKSTLDEYKKTIIEWALKNPEIEYPTWAEWLSEQGLMTDVNPDIPSSGNFLYNRAREKIPANKARKMGIIPKIKNDIVYPNKEDVNDNGYLF